MDKDVCETRAVATGSLWLIAEINFVRVRIHNLAICLTVKVIDLDLVVILLLLLLSALSLLTLL